MTRGQLEAFLTDSGVIFSMNDGDPSWVDFKNRGTAMSAITYDKGDLLHLTCTYIMPPDSSPLAQVQAIFQALEDEYPIVKLSSVRLKDWSGFMVSAEQFEPDLEHIGDVFWRTADLLVGVADECFRRLGAKPDKNPDDKPANRPDSSRWVSSLEEALRQGSGRPGSPADGGESAIAFATVKSALALVLTEDCSTGTAFCVASDASGSYYVTNAHVVRTYARVTLYRQKPLFEKSDATVIAKDNAEGSDLAILRVNAPELPRLNVQERPPKNESAVALAGYARAHIWAAEEFGELTPSIRLGTITGVLKSGSCVLHDVLCRPGDSGGPLFDPASGDVVGVQTAGWQDEEEGYAIGAPMLAAFLNAAKALTA